MCSSNIFSNCVQLLLRVKNDDFIRRFHPKICAWLFLVSRNLKFTFYKSIFPLFSIQI